MTTNETPVGGHLAIAAMSAAGASVARIVSELDVSPATIYRVRREHSGWIKDRREEKAAELLGQLMNNTRAAADALVSLLTDPNGPTRLGAAKALLDQASKWRSEIDLEARVAELEERFGYGSR